MGMTTTPAFKSKWKEATGMNTAKYVQDQILVMKNAGIPYSEIAWKTALNCVGWAYVFGARGEYCDPSNRRSRAREDHPTIKSSCKNFNGTDNVPAGCVGCKWFLGSKDSDEKVHEGRTRFFDCRGFTYWVLKQVYGWELKGAGATTQWNNSANWSAKGDIASMPADTLVCLFVKKGNVMEHTGFGFNNETVECSVGVQHFTKRNKKWTHWGVPACVSGDIPTPTPGPGTDKPTLRKGDKGPYVTLLQTDLINRGYSLPKYGADGSFGNETVEAVKQFQRDWGLYVDGIVGPGTWDMLESSPVRKKFYTVTIPHLSRETAEELLTKYTGTMTEE